MLFSVKLRPLSLTPPLRLLPSPVQVSEYPVILSIENHCSVEQQRVMARHLTHILGDKLLKSALGGKAPIRLPSPEVRRTVFFSVSRGFPNSFMSRIPLSKTRDPCLN